MRARRWGELGLPSGPDPRPSVGRDRRARPLGVAVAEGDSRVSPRVLIVGEPMVELVEEGPGLVRRGFGGDTFNTAVYLSRAAPELIVTFLSAVGVDEPSDELLQLARTEGIDASRVLREPDTRLGRYTVRTDQAGERSFEYEREHSPFRGMLDAEPDVLPAVATVDLLYFSGISMAVLHEPGRERLLRYAREVRRDGGQVAYDPNHRASLWSSAVEARALMTRVMASADLVLASVDDGRALTGLSSAAEIASELRRRGANEVAVTAGSA